MTANTNSAAPLKSIVLHCTEDGSDKIYAMQLVAVGSGFAVNYQNGKRNSRMTNETNFPAPVTLEVAEKKYAAKLNEKLKKHYKPIGGDAGPGAQQAPLTTRTDSGIRLQLLNEIEMVDASKYIADRRWIGQQKYDGERLALQSVAGVTSGVNRLGYVVSLPLEVANEATVLARDFVLDAEIIGDRVYAFDLIELDGKDLRGRDAESRLDMLSDLLRSQSGARSYIVCVGTARTTEEKQALFDMLTQQAQEGMVFKLASSTYVEGRPNSGGDQVKCKFWKSATVEVSMLNTSAGKKSFAFQVYDHSGGAIPMGNCNMTKPVNVGDLVEVRYLNANLGGALFQPTFLRKHTDKLLTDCTVSQLKYKAPHQDMSTGLQIIAAIASNDAPSAKAKMLKI